MFMAVSDISLFAEHANPLPPDINDNNTISFERRGFLSGLQDYYGYGKMGNYHMFKTVFGFRIGYRVR
jgi:hypothetical protein